MSSPTHEPLSALYGLTVAEDMPEVFARHWDAFGLRLETASWNADPNLVPRVSWRRLVAEWVAADFGGNMRTILALLRNFDPACRRMTALYSAGPEGSSGLRRRWVGPGLVGFLGGAAQFESREAMLFGLVEGALARHRPLHVRVETHEKDSNQSLPVLILPFASFNKRRGALVLGSTA